MENIEKAKELFLSKKYKESFSLFKSLASTSPEAAYYQGMHFYLGLEVKQNYDKAYGSFKQSWEGLYHEGIFMMGRMHEAGHGVEKNINQAFKFYQAANQSVNAKTRLAKMYEEGIGVERDLVKALKLYNELQKLGSAYAMYKIGRFYLSGQGLKKNQASGFEWLEKAMHKNEILAINYFRLVGSKPDSDNRTVDEIYQQGLSAIGKEDQESALSFLELAAHEGSIQALLRIVDEYVKGSLFEEDKEKAFNLLLKRQDLNNGEIFYRIGNFYELGIGVTTSYYRAGLFYQKALQLNHEAAKIALRELRGY